MKSDIGNEQNWQQIEAGYVCTNLSSILSNRLSRLLKHKRISPKPGNTIRIFATGDKGSDTTKLGM